MAWKFAIASFALIASVTALSAPPSHIVHEKRDTSLERWVKRARVPSFAKLPVRIGLVQSNMENAQEFLLDIAHPYSPNYGKHWSAEQVIEAFKPADDTVETVRTWLVDAGIKAEAITYSDNKAWLAFHATAKEMESLLHTEYWEFQDMHTGGIMPACDQYHVPEYVSKHIDYITPGIKLLAPMEKPEEHQKRSLTARSWPHQGQPYREGPWPKHHYPTHPYPHHNNKSDLSICDVEITPACIAALYDIPPGHLADPSNSMGIFEAELQYWDQHDLNSFFTNFTHIPNGTHPIDKLIDGGVAIAPNISAAGEESMLDLDMAYPIVYPQTITVWNVDDIHYQIWPNDTYTWGFNTLLDALDGSYCTYCAYGECGDLKGVDPKYPDPGPNGYPGRLQCGVFKPTNVFSLSYGGQEVGVPIAYQKRQCNEYLKLGLQGVSFLFASGDAGVGNYPKPYGTGCIGPGKKIFDPTWPVNCPWVTAVGATKVYPGYTVFEPESAVFDPAGHPYNVNYSSGGGFSNVYPVPAYQKSAVETFFKDHNPQYPYYSGLVSSSPKNVYEKPDVVALAGNSGGVYNRIGRGIPDVAANGDNGAIYFGGNFSLSGGTSQATPIFASVINRINEERIAAGKSSLGFLNAALYSHPEILNDITNGTNPGCGTLGFSAVKGWDPVTGLGTPNYLRMLEFFMSLP